jgi:hypothetical protein
MIPHPSTTFKRGTIHYPVLVKVNVFIEDPYDAVGSFGIQLAVLSALVSFVRILRPYPKGITSNNLILILHGNAVSLLSVAVTLTADIIAMFRYLPEWTNSSAGWLLAAFISGLMALTALAGWMVFHMGQSLNLLSGYRPWSKTIAVCLVGLIVLAFYPEAWQQSVPGGIFAALAGMVFLFVLSSVIAKLVFPPAGGQYEDFLDDLFVLYQWLKVHANFAGFLFGWMEKLVNIPWVHALTNWLNPRKHTWNSVILVALGMGIALVMAEAIGEGMPSHSVVLMVLTVFISIEGFGVLLGYVLFKQFLGIFRS